MDSSFLGRLRGKLAHEVKVRLAGTELDTLVEHRDRRRLRWIATEAEDECLRLRALRHLAEMNDKEAAPLFLSFVEAPAGTVAPLWVRFAAEGLGRLGAGEFVPPLTRLLGPDRPFGLILAACRGLANLGGNEAWGAVRKACEAHATALPDGRDTASEGGDLPAGIVVAGAVFQHCFPDQEPRWWRTKAATWLKGEEPAPRIAANQGADRAVAGLLRPRIERREGSPDERRALLLQLGTLGLSRDHELLASKLSSSPDDARPALWAALGHHADPASAALLAGEVGQAARSADRTLDLLRALGRTLHPGAVPAILDLATRHRSPSVSQELAWALGEVGGERAVASLIDAARTGQDGTGAALDDEGLRWVATALRRTGRPGLEGLRGARAIARAGGGERDRLEIVAGHSGLR